MGMCVISIEQKKVLNEIADEWQEKDPYTCLMKQHDYLKTLQSNRDKIYWITLCPREGIDPEHFIFRINHFLQRQFVKESHWVLEQRGETLKTMGTGMHAHILFDKTVGLSPKQLRTCIESTFKGYFGNYKHVTIQVFPKSMRQDKVDYCNGKKWDSDKDAKLFFDKKFREKHLI